MTHALPASNWRWLFSTEMVTLGLLLIAASPLGMVIPDGNIYRYLLLLLGGLTLIPAAGFYFSYGRNRFFWLLCLGYFEFLSWLHSDGDIELQQTVFRYVCFTAFFAGQGLLLASHYDQRKTKSSLLQWTLSAVSVLMIPFMLAWVLQGQETLVVKSGRFTMGELNPVGIGFLFGNVFAISFSLFMFNRSIFKAAWAIVAVLSLLIILQTGSRGPLLAAFAVVLVPIFFATAPEARRTRLTSLFFGFALIGVIVAMIITFLPEQFDFLIRRYNRLMDEGVDLNVASSGRIDIWMSYLELRDQWIWFGNPQLVDSFDTYAHNVVLDVGITFGIIGILFLFTQLFFVGKLVLRWQSLSLDTHMIALLTAGLFTLAVSMISCKIFMLRALWLLMGIATASAAMGRQDKPPTISDQDPAYR